jgi:REP-associated tyrosine transposase
VQKVINKNNQVVLCTFNTNVPSDVPSDAVFSRGRQDQKVRARSLFCYWAVRELGMSLTDLAREFELSVSRVGYAVEKGGRIAGENNYSLRAML